MLTHNDFIFWAEKAVTAEQRREWPEATACWEKAAVFAQNADNRHWAEARHEWCTARQLRPLAG